MLISSDSSKAFTSGCILATIVGFSNDGAFESAVEEIMSSTELAFVSDSINVDGVVVDDDVDVVVGFVTSGSVAETANDNVS